MATTASKTATTTKKTAVKKDPAETKTTVKKSVTKAVVAEPKVAAKKTVAPKAADVSKAPAAKKAAAKPASHMTPEQRYNTIATRAYYLAERRGFVSGYEMQDWVAAEFEVDSKLHG